MGKEKGKSGTPHLQGYIELLSRKRMSTLKESVKISRMHLERRSGTPQEAAQYSKKDGDFWEHREIIGQGKDKI